MQHQSPTSVFLSSSWDELTPYCLSEEHSPFDLQLHIARNLLHHTDMHIYAHKNTYVCICIYVHIHIQVGVADLSTNGV